MEVREEEGGGGVKGRRSEGGGWRLAGGLLCCVANLKSDNTHQTHDPAPTPSKAMSRPVHSGNPPLAVAVAHSAALRGHLTRHRYMSPLWLFPSSSLFIALLHQAEEHARPATE